MMKDIEFDYKSMSFLLNWYIVEDDEEYIEKRLLQESQNVDAITEIQKYEDWIALNNNNKKLLTYKFQNIRKDLNEEFNNKLTEYLKI